MTAKKASGESKAHVGLAEKDTLDDGSNSECSDVGEDVELLSWDGMDDRDCFATVKTVCDAFALEDSPPQGYYFYEIKVVVPEEFASLGCGSSKDELDQCLLALNGLGFILRSPVPEDVLQAKSDLFLSDSKMTMTLDHLGVVSEIPDEDMLHLQRFHRAVCCMEDVNACTSDQYLSMEHNFIDGVIPTELISQPDWTKSSNGAWYMVFPLSPLHTTTVGATRCYDAANVKRCADQAQVLIHNLRVVGASVTNKPCRVPEAESCAQYPQEAWKDILLLANGISLCCAAEDSEHNRKTLKDVMKRIKYTPPPPLPAPEFVVVPGPQKGTGTPFPAPLVVMRSEDVGPIPVTRINFSEYIDITYADYFKAKRPHLISAIERYVNDPNHRLVAANQVSTKTAHTLLLTPICVDVRGNPDWIKRNSVHNARVERLHFLAEQCRPLGLQRWYFTSRLIPSVMHRIQSWLLAHEARDLMTARIAALEEAAPAATSAEPTMEVSDQTDEKQIAEHFSGVKLESSSPADKKLRNNDAIPRPSLKLMLEAMTPRMVAESFDSER
jgi:hypothetical protein